LQRKFLQLIEEVAIQIRESPEEEIAILNLDFLPF
jgi:hypothetical protein